MKSVASKFMAFYDKGKTKKNRLRKSVLFSTENSKAIQDILVDSIALFLLDTNFGRNNSKCALVKSSFKVFLHLYI